MCFKVLKVCHTPPTSFHQRIYIYSFFIRLKLKNARQLLPNNDDNNDDDDGDGGRLATPTFQWQPQRRKINWERRVESRRRSRCVLIDVDGGLAGCLRLSPVLPFPVILLLSLPFWFLRFGFLRSCHQPLPSRHHVPEKSCSLAKY